MFKMGSSSDARPAWLGQDLTGSLTGSGFQHREQAGLDKAHPGGDPGEDHPPERRPEGAHSHPQDSPGRAAQGQAVSVRGLKSFG